MLNEVEIAQRLFSKNDTSTSPAVRVAIGGMVIGVLVMIVTIFVVVGFKDTIREKVVGFGAHLQVVNFDNNNTYEMQPIRIDQRLLDTIAAVEGIVGVSPFATKPGMIKTEDAFQAIVYKGAINEPGARNQESGTRNQDFFTHHLVRGRMPSKSNEVLISSTLAQQMELDTMSSFYCYFIQDQIRVRRLTVTGIYNTDFTEYDKIFVIGDIHQVQQLNGWDSTQVSGIEAWVDNFDEIDAITNRVYFRTANREDADGNFLYAQNITQTTPAIFSWLALLDMNVIIIIILMLCVSGVCMCSGLIILILESVQFIGIMNALGAANTLIQRIYLWQAAFLIGRGMLLGNIIGLLLCALQYFFHIIPLEASAYYVSYVPITFAWGWWGILNIGTFVVSMTVMLLPSAIISRISPAQVMRYE